MKKKTWKREVASVLLLFFMWVVTGGNVELVEVIVWPIFTFAGLSFGLDWFSKSGGVQQPLGDLDTKP